MGRKAIIVGDAQSAVDAGAGGAYPLRDMSGEFIDPLGGDDNTQEVGSQPMLAGRYLVIRDLGQGAMGKVLLAVDTQLDNLPVAVKVPTVLVAQDSQAVKRMQKEALLARRLSHPNIVTLRTLEQSDGGVFLVMDYVDGQTLQDLLGEREALSEEEVAELFQPLAAALDYAHEEKVIHRDIKPSNILIRRDGRPYLTDFGIARELKDSLTRLTGKSSSGTLPYMSPEQLYGEAPSPAQDIYSLAATMYECLAGHPPFFRGEIAVQIAQKLPEPPTNSDSRFVAQIMKALAKDAAKRPACCAEILEPSSAPPEPVAPSRRPPPLPPLTIPLPAAVNMEPAVHAEASPPQLPPRGETRPPPPELLEPRRRQSLASLTALCIVFGTLQAALFPFYPSLAPICAIVLISALTAHVRRRRDGLYAILDEAEAAGALPGAARMLRTSPSLGLLSLAMLAVAVVAACGMVILLLEDFNELFDALDDEDVGIAAYSLGFTAQMILLTISWIAFQMILRRHRREEMEVVAFARQDPAWLEEQRDEMAEEWSGDGVLGRLLLIPIWPLVFPLVQLRQLRRHLDWETANDVADLLADRE